MQYAPPTVMQEWFRVVETILHNSQKKKTNL